MVKYDFTKYKYDTYVCATGGRKIGAKPHLKKRQMREYRFFWEKLDELRVTRFREQFLHFGVGDAKGFDEIIRDWCEANIYNGVSLRVFKADWDKYGDSAGPIRNREMIDTHKPTLLLAGPGGTGTKDCIDYAKHKGVKPFYVGFKTHPEIQNEPQRLFLKG